VLQLEQSPLLQELQLQMQVLGFTCFTALLVKMAACIFDKKN
jgi:hypothetical protein